ncbi:MAG: phosphoribosylformylglycinamidine synthase subunit PurS, partial [bacterium]|nr:phosphoribosylformylglycinamidine synthase subunit PurS [bacterium]
MPQFEIEVFVKLRVPDRVALTAQQALERMGYGDRLTGLCREDYYQLLVEAKDEAEALTAVNSVVEDTPIFANPNKHTVRIEPKQRPRSADNVYAALTYG